MKYLVENGSLHCARVEGHLKEGPHGDNQNQGTDHADHRRNGITKPSKTVFPWHTMQQIVGGRLSSIRRRFAPKHRVPCLDPCAAYATLEGGLFLGEEVPS